MWCSLMHYYVIIVVRTGSGKALHAIKGSYRLKMEMTDFEQEVR
jgi:hypothetical protein